MKINPDIFRAYDIRGVYPTEINENIAYLIGHALVRFLNKKKLKIAIARDGRLSSGPLFHSLKKALIEEGVTVVNLDLITSPMFYWAVANYGFDAGVYITASHNPPQYNGFKIVKTKAEPISSLSGLKKIKETVLTLAKQKRFKKTKGQIINKKILNDYLEFNLKKISYPKTKEKKENFKIIIDTGNAVAGLIIKPLFNKLKKYFPFHFQLIHLFSEIDGSFPHHLPDPLKRENIKTLCQTVRKKKAQLGVAFDGDGDRIIFVDEKGKKIPSDLITALIAQFILQYQPKEKILYDIRSSNIVREVIKKFNGQPVAWKIGHAFIKEKMKKDNIIFGGEFSGHYYHRDYYFTDCPIFVLIKILEILATIKKPFSQIIKPLQKYFHSGEINFKIKDKEKVIKKLSSYFKNGQIKKLDGLRIDFDQWWFLVRPSNTEPLIRLVVEAKEKNLMREKVKELKEIIQKN